MPVMDGFELLAYVKAHPVLKTIPVVVLTTSNNERDITRAYQLGVNSYIVKPNTFEGLLTVAAAMRDQWFRANLLPPMPPPGEHP
jgi:CheY-like chemotaxis protein